MKLGILFEARRPGWMYSCSNVPDSHKVGFSKPLDFNELGEFNIQVAYHKISPDTTTPSLSEMIKAIKEWSGGKATDIWVSSYPATLYGDNCYKVKVPRDAILIDDNYQVHYTSGGKHTETSVEVEYRHYLCKGPITSSNFKPVSDKARRDG